MKEAIAEIKKVARKDPVRAGDGAVTFGFLALHWLVQGYGYDITGADVWMAYTATMQAAESAASASSTRERIRQLVAGATFGERFVTGILGRELGL